MTMTYSVTIEGTTDDPHAEHDLFNALAAVTENAEFGVTAASGKFAFAGDVALPTPGSTPPPDSTPTVDDLLAAVAADVQAIDPSDPAAAKLTADFNELATAIHAGESEQPSPASPDEPATSDEPPSTIETNEAGDAVAL